MTSIVSHQTVRLRRGKHASPEKGVCVMELASMLAGEPFSDRPQAVCPVIGAYLRSYNDVVDDDRRQDLYRYASEAIGSAGPAALRRRRAERCLAEIARLHDQRSRVRRWLSGRPELSLPGSSIELERVGMHLARALQRSGPRGTHARWRSPTSSSRWARAPGAATSAARWTGVSPLRCRSERHGDGASRAHARLAPVVGCPGGAARGPGGAPRPSAPRPGSQ